MASFDIGDALLGVHGIDRADVPQIALTRDDALARARLRLPFGTVPTAVLRMTSGTRTSFRTPPSEPAIGATAVPSEPAPPHRRCATVQVTLHFRMQHTWELSNLKLR